MMDDTYEPRKEKESLCFLILGFKKQQQDYTIIGWQICYSYDNKITRKIVCWSSNERCCLASLIHELLWCSIHNTSVVTYRTIDMPALRTRLLVNNITTLDFRQLQCACLQQLVKNFFFLPEEIQNLSITSLADAMKINTRDVISVELLRELFIQIQPLLPTEVV